MDFDLSGMGFDNIEVPNTIARPVVSEPSVDMASIDFDFLLESPPVAGVPDADPAIAAVPSIYSDEPTPLVPEEASEPISTGSPADELPPLSMDLPNVEEIHASKPDNSPVEANADRLDFDLSDISLELDPAEAEPKPDLVFETHDTFDSDSDALSSTDAEMATKLDLAIAYQEIGDKEGARELLDEVIKAGSVEQSQKAKALLLELA
jgi:pilus assembly protein FimV